MKRDAWQPSAPSQAMRVQKFTYTGHSMMPPSPHAAVEVASSDDAMLSAPEDSLPFGFFRRLFLKLLKSPFFLTA